MAFTQKELEDLGKVFARHLTESMKSAGITTGATGQSQDRTARGSSNTKSKRVTEEVAMTKMFRNLNAECKTLADVLEKVTKESKYTFDSLGNVVGANEKYQTAVKLLNRRLADTTDVFQEMNDESRNMHGSMLETASQLNRFSKSANRLTDTVAKNIAKSSIFGSTMLRSHSMVEEGSNRYYKMIDELQTASKPLNRGILRAANAWDSSAESLKNNLSADDFARIRTAIGAVEATIAEDLGKFNISSVQGMIKDIVSRNYGNVGSVGEHLVKSENQLSETFVALAAKLEKQGVDLDLKNSAGKKVSLLNEDGSANADVMKQISTNAKMMDDVVAAIDNVSRSNSKAIGDMTEVAKSSNLAHRNLAKVITDSVPALRNMKEAASKFGEISSIMGAIGSFVDSIKRMHGELQSFNIAGINASYFEASAASVRLGLSLDELVKFGQENKRSIALMGNDTAAYGEMMKGTFSKFGYNMEQATKIIPSMNDAAVAFGVNMRDPARVKGFLETTMTSFGELRKVINITAEEYYKSTEALMSEEDMRNTMLSMGRDQAQAYASQTIAIRDNYATILQSTEQANAMIKAQQKQARAPLANRMREGAKAMMLAKQVGWSDADARKLMDLSMRGHNDPAAKAELATYLGKLQKDAQTAESSALNDNNLGKADLIRRLIDTLLSGGDLGTIAQQQQAVNTAQRANAVVTPEEGKKLESVAGSPEIAELGNAVNSVSSLLNNTLVTAVWSSVIAVGAMAFAAAKAALALKSIGGFGLGGMGPPDPGGGGRKGVFNRIKGAFSRAGSVVMDTAKGAGSRIVNAVSGVRAAGLGGVARGAAGLVGSGIDKIKALSSTAGSALANNATKVGPMLKGAAGLLKGNAITAIAMGALTAASSMSDINDKVERGELSEEEGNAAKGGALGRAGGMAAGAAGGAAAGAAIGTMIFPGVGTVVGGLIGGLAAGDLFGDLGETLGTQAVTLFQDGGALDTVATTISSTAGNLWEGISAGAGALATFSGSVLSAAGPALAGLFPVVSGAFTAGKALLNGGFDGLAKSLGSYGTTVLNGVASAGRDLMAAAPSLTTLLAGAAGPIAAGLTLFGQSVLPSIDTVKGALSTVGSTIATGTSALATKAGEVLVKTTSFVSDLLPILEKFLSWIAKYNPTNLIMTAGQGAAGAIAKLWNGDSPQVTPQTNNQNARPGVTVQPGVHTPPTPSQSSASTQAAINTAATTTDASGTRLAVSDFEVKEQLMQMVLKMQDAIKLLDTIAANTDIVGSVRRAEAQTPTSHPPSKSTQTALGAAAGAAPLPAPQPGRAMR